MPRKFPSLVPIVAILGVVKPVIVTVAVLRTSARSPPRNAVLVLETQVDQVHPAMLFVAVLIPTEVMQTQDRSTTLSVRLPDLLIIGVGLRRNLSPAIWRLHFRKGDARSSA